MAHPRPPRTSRCGAAEDLSTRRPAGVVEPHRRHCCSGSVDERRRRHRRAIAGLQARARSSWGGPVERYEHSFRLWYLRGPEGILFMLSGTAQLKRLELACATPQSISTYALPALRCHRTSSPGEVWRPAAQRPHGSRSPEDLRGARAAVASRGRARTGQVDAGGGTTVERRHARMKGPPRSARSRRSRRDRVEVIGFEPTASSLRTKPQPHGVHGADVRCGLSSTQMRRFGATPPDSLPSCNTATSGRLRQIPAPDCGAAVEQTPPARSSRER